LKAAVNYHMSGKTHQPGVALPVVRPVATDGADAWSAERLPTVKACHPAPPATFSAKGPGFESYTVLVGGTV
jgi:hypothetical protein